jgi:hypothetical protein
MFPDFNFVDAVVMFLGVLFCFKKVAEMERYHDLRVIVLTSICGAILLVFFVWFSATLGDMRDYGDFRDDYFTESEM